MLRTLAEASRHLSPRMRLDSFSKDNDTNRDKKALFFEDFLSLDVFTPLGWTHGRRLDYQDFRKPIRIAKSEILILSGFDS